MNITGSSGPVFLLNKMTMFNPGKMKTKNEVSAGKEHNLILKHSRKQLVLFCLFVILTILAIV